MLKTNYKMKSARLSKASDKEVSEYGCSREIKSKQLNVLQ